LTLCITQCSASLRARPQMLQTSRTTPSQSAGLETPPRAARIERRIIKRMIKRIARAPLSQMMVRTPLPREAARQMPPKRTRLNSMSKAGDRHRTTQRRKTRQVALQLPRKLSRRTSLTKPRPRLRTIQDKGRPRR